VIRLAGGLVAGLSATLLMEYASQFLYERQAPASREREETLRTEMPTTTLVRKAAGLAGTQLGDATAERLGMVTHYAFGAAGGPLAVAFTDRGVGPLKAGLAVATAMELGADQGVNTVLGLTPPPQAWPLVTHARAVAAHVAYGAALGLLLAAGGCR
jgi:hypothetical protein